jgi:hypothetical protein
MNETEQTTNELVIPSVSHQVGSVHFHNYEEILQQATELAEYVSNVVVTEESVKATKKMLASVNKKVTELEDGRKAIKKELLKPYEEFEQKIKTIAKVVKDADQVVRSQVRELEERERQEKRDAVAQLFFKRLKLYPTLSMLMPSDFITNQHLNKTISLDKVEQEMVQWFLDRNQDVEYIMENFGEPLDIIVEYVNTQNLVQSIQTVEQRKKAKEEITGKKETPKQNTVTIVIDGKDLQSVEAFMKLSNIKYEIKGR